MLSQENILKCQIKRALVMFYDEVDPKNICGHLDLWLTRVDYIKNYQDAKLAYFRFRDTGLVQFPIKKWNNVMKSIMKLIKHYEKSE